MMVSRSGKALTLLALGAISVFAVTAMSGPAWAGCGSCGGGDKHADAENKSAHSAHKAKAAAADNEDGQACPGKAMQEERVARIESLMKHVEEAEKALKAGNTEGAVAELEKVKTQLAELHEKEQACKDKGDDANTSQDARPAVVNTTCPIMGSKINPKKVPAKLYRVYDGKGVGFCCGGCPTVWDKLSDEEKAAKLKAVTPES